MAVFVAIGTGETKTVGVWMAVGTGSRIGVEFIAEQDVTRKDNDQYFHETISFRDVHFW